MSKRILLLILIPLLILTFVASYEASDSAYDPGFVINTNITEDGHYAITTHYNHALILWDIEKHEYKILSKEASRAVPHFLNNYEFIWKDEKERLHHTIISTDNIIDREEKNFLLWSSEEIQKLFVDDEHYLKIYSTKKIGLFKKDIEAPIKMLTLSQPSTPLLFGEKVIHSFASSAQKHIVVTGQDTGNGINVYEYSPDTEELSLTWSAGIN